MDCVLVAGFAFLLGFKIAAYMGKRHLERMKQIWDIPTAGNQQNEPRHPIKDERGQV
jgi:hypothetical protein